VHSASHSISCNPDNALTPAPFDYVPLNPAPSVCSITSIDSIEGYACEAGDIFAYGATLLLTLFGPSGAAGMIELGPLLPLKFYLSSLIRTASGCLKQQEGKASNGADEGEVLGEYKS
jgi:hypothetical protein